jgi:hypothetical protein
VGRSFGKSLLSGCGTCVSNWGIISLQRPCVSLRRHLPKQSSRPLSHPRSPLSEREIDGVKYHDAGRDLDPESEPQGNPQDVDSQKDPPPSVLYGAKDRAGTSREGIFRGTDFVLQPDGTLRCPTNHPLSPQERRAECDGTLRVVYAARIGDCRACPLREQCLAHGNEAKHARRVSAVLRRIEGPSPPPVSAPPPESCTKPMLWGDWSRCQTRRRLMRLLRTQTVTITLTSAPVPDTAHRDALTWRERKHTRLTWEQRLARNAYGPSEPRVSLHLFGIPAAFAQAIGLLSVA